MAGVAAASEPLAEEMAVTRSMQLRRHSLSPHLGLPQYTIRRLLLVAVCILGVVQYGVVLVFGVVEADLAEYYHLSIGEAAGLYTWENLGACALSFVPGLCYDHLGAMVAMILGTVCGCLPVIAQLVWLEGFPFVSNELGLSICYLLFGLSASFYNVIGCFAALCVFDKKDTGKVSAVVQVCLSLGVTVQSAAYKLFKGMPGDFLRHYLLYVLISTIVCGALITFVIWVCQPVMCAPKPPAPAEPTPEPLEERSHSDGDSFAVREEAAAAAAAAEAAAADEEQPLSKILCSTEFAFMTIFFLLAVGFSFSFLEVEGRMALAAGIRPSDLADAFGVLNALGRIAVSVPLDYTQSHPLGGVFTYLVAAVFLFALGLSFLALPSSPGASAVYTTNVFVALGYGGLMGIVPPALRLHFGTQHLGVVYGLLYLWVYFSVLVFGIASTSIAGDCKGVHCYRAYNMAGAVCSLVVVGLGITMLARGMRRRRQEREVHLI